MMECQSAAPMSRHFAIHHRASLGRWAGLGFSAALLLPGIAVLANQQPILYPPASLFRSLQLTALACGRDNDAASCDKARTMADPLLDHPRLSATCKDTLWVILQSSRAAETNSRERRDVIDRAAKDVTVFCRQPATPAASSSTPSGGAPGQPGSGASGGGGGSLFSPPPSR